MYEIHLKDKSVLKEEITFPVSMKRKSSRIDMSKVLECYVVAWFSCSAGLKEIHEVPKITRKYPEVPKSTQKYPEVPGRTRKYPEVPRRFLCSPIYKVVGHPTYIYLCNGNQVVLICPKCMNVTRLHGFLVVLA